MFSVGFAAQVIWILITVSTGYNSHGTTTVVGKFRDEATCVRVAEAVKTLGGISTSPGCVAIDPASLIKD